MVTYVTVAVAITVIPYPLRNNPKCPVCNVPINESLLKKDEKLQRLVRKEKRQKGRGQRSNKQGVVQL